MSGNGLAQVENPSEMLLTGRPLDVSGTCITCLMEGTRPILVEVQALIAKTSFGNPRRVPTGFDYNRTALLIAVLEKRGGYFMGNLDVFINVAGGMRIDDTGADLAVALCMVSNLLDKPVHSKLLALGEIGLAGEVRSVGLVQQRVSEAYRLGYAREQIVAFGDGLNDCAMLGCAGVGVAMGDAHPVTKAAADYITASAGEDGIYIACRHLGLI